MATVSKTGEKMVKIQLFKDDGRYANDVFVGVNGKTYQIKRGVDVEVPESVAEVLKNSERQNAEAFHVMNELQKDAEW